MSSDFGMKLMLMMMNMQLQAPRRQCCDVLPSNGGEGLDIAIRDCKEEELIHMH